MIHSRIRGTFPEESSREPIKRPLPAASLLLADPWRISHCSSMLLASTLTHHRLRCVERRLHLYSIGVFGEGVPYRRSPMSDTCAFFHTYRPAVGADADDAAARIHREIIKEWKSGKYAPYNRGGLPTLKTEYIFKVDFWSWLSHFWHMS